jgi:predicted permease
MGRHFISRFWPDIRQVITRLGGRPVYVAAVVVTLALAMGAAVAVFGLVDALLLHPLTLPRADELVTLQKRYLKDGVEQRGTTLSWPQVNRLRPIQGFSQMVVSTNHDDNLSAHSSVTLPNGEAAQPPLRFVSGNYFDVVQVRVEQGRRLLPSDDTVGAPIVAVASHQWWAREFAGAVPLDQVVRINNVPVTIVGVLAADFVGLELGTAPPALYLPLTSAPAVGRDSMAAGDIQTHLRGDSAIATAPTVFPASAFQVLARVSSGRAALQAEAITRLRSDEWAVVPVVDTMLPFEHVKDARTFIRVLVGAVAIAVAVACLNVAVLMFAGGQERAGEYAIRRMLGAAPADLARLVAVESAALACGAGLGAGAVAWTVRQAAITLVLPGGTAAESASWQPWRAAVFAILLSVIVAALIAIVPMRYARRRPDAARTSTADRGQTKTLSVLVALQAGACVVLVLTAAVFLRAVHLRLTEDLGFRDQGLLTAEVALARDQRNELALEYQDRTLREVRGLPGVRRAAIGPAPLLTGSDWTTSAFIVDGIPRATEAPVDMIYVGDDYFETLRQVGLRGRDFETRDTFKAPFVVIVNAVAAKLFWPGTDALGHKILLTMFTRAPSLNRDLEVIAVVPDVTLHHLAEPAKPTLYLSRQQFHDYLAGFTSGSGRVSLLIRSDADVSTLTPSLSAAVRAQGQQLLSLVSIAERRREMVQPQRLAGALLVFLGGIIAFVTVIGAYATGHMTALRQRRAHAIRIALGANPAGVVRAAVWRWSSVLVAGVCGGLLVAWMSRPLVEGAALGTRLLDPLVVALATAAVCVTGGLAVYVPLRRIGEIDPALLLRD